MAGPFAFLYILVVTRTGQEEARYQLDATLSLDEITTLLREYRDFFEYDARHIIYLYSFDDDATLVYDRHNLIYAYGNLDRYTAFLSQAGYFPATVQVPTPHAHHYHKQFDDCETRLIDSNKWSISGLRDIDLA